MKRLKHKRRGGYSLVELMIGMTLMGSLGGAAILATNSGLGSYESARTGELLQTKLHRTGNRIIREIMSSGTTVLGPGELTTASGTESINFAVPIDMDETGPTWGPGQTIACVMSPGEVDDGIDNDNNGLIDERVVVLTRNGQSVTLCTNVRETFPGEIAGNFIDDNGNGVVDEDEGFNVILVDDVVTINICVEVPGFNGTTVTRQITTSTRMRN